MHHHLIGEAGAMTRESLKICHARSCDEGATAVEYAIMASLIAAVIATTVALIGVRVLALFASVPGF
jgi:Flp pilus assembly pilin Flp